MKVRLCHFSAQNLPMAFFRQEIKLKAFFYHDSKGTVITPRLLPGSQFLQLSPCPFYSGFTSPLLLLEDIVSGVLQLLVSAWDVLFWDTCMFSLNFFRFLLRCHFILEVLPDHSLKQHPMPCCPLSLHKVFTYCHLDIFYLPVYCLSPPPHYNVSFMSARAHLFCLLLCYKIDNGA